MGSGKHAGKKRELICVTHAHALFYKYRSREFVDCKANVQGIVLPGCEAWFRLVHNSR